MNNNKVSQRLYIQIDAKRIEYLLAFHFISGINSHVGWHLSLLDLSRCGFQESKHNEKKRNLRQQTMIGYTYDP